MNGKVICNTGPIVALSMIGRIDILRDLFELVSVPEAVHMEILEGELDKGQDDFQPCRPFIENGS